MAVQRRFSVQKHESSEVHYLLNLVVGDSIRSWAIPGGPSQDPRIKRLAFPVQNALSLDFEGLDSSNVFCGDIRKRVIVWDSGTFSTFEFEGERLSARESLSLGRLEVNLNGSKLQGGFSLLRVEEAPNERWIFMKIFDDNASHSDPTIDMPQSVVSGRELEQLTGEVKTLRRKTSDDT